MTKTITFDKGDYRAEVDGVLLGYYRTRSQAETACNEYVYETLARAA